MEEQGDKLKVFVVEDHPNLRRLVSLFLDMQPDMECCGMADSAEAALYDLQAIAADLVLVDLSLPKMNGLELIAALRLEQPGLVCIILTALDDPEFEAKALEAGAQGYILKGSPSEMGTAIRRIWKDHAEAV